MCVRENHGDDCIGEFVKYTWKYSSKKGFEITNPSGTCARELGECDKKFVLDTSDHKDLYKEKNNYFYGGYDKHWTWMGTNKNQCCINPKNNKEQTVTPIG